MSFTPPNIPQVLRERRQWLVWRLVKQPDEPKPRKVPFYVSGRPRGKTADDRNVEQGSAEDVAALGTFDEAVAAVQSRGYTGLGFALLAGSGIIALDFDHCVRDGQVLDSRIEPLVQTTYTEVSPSGTGLRAFFTGDIKSRKDNAPKAKRVGGVDGAARLDGLFDIEVFGTNGFVTVTGNATGNTDFWGLNDTVAPLTPEVKALYRQRFRDTGALEMATDESDPFFDGSASGVAASGAGGSLVPFAGGNGVADLATLGPQKLGWSIEQAREYLFNCSASVSRQEWLNALMSVHYEFDGSDEALDLADEWSATGDSYAGRRDVEGRWRSFGRHSGGAPVTGRWLLAWRREQLAAGNDDRMREALDQLGVALKAVPDMVAVHTRVMPDVAKLLFEFPVLEVEVYSLVAARAKEFDMSVTKAEFKKLVRRERPEPAREALSSLTEFGNAERLVKKYGERLMYVPDAEQWYVWTGNNWRKAWGNRTEVEHFAKDVINDLPLEKDAHHNNQEEFFAFCAASQRAHMVAAMVKLAESDPALCVPSMELDKHMHFLGVKNGVVDLRTGQLLPAKQEYRITTTTACEYSPGAKCPEFEKVLRDAFYNDTDMIEYVVRTMGYSLQGNPKERAMFIPFGKGANGKGTIFNAVRTALGGYACVAEPDTFLGDARGGNGGGPREDIVRLRGIRFLYVNEPESNGVLREGLIKAMTGGDTLQARGVHAKSSIEITPTWAIFMPTNYKPIVTGDDNGIWSRIRLLPFERNFNDDPDIKEDPDIKDRIAANELPGILALMVRAGLRYRQVGLGSPAKVKQHTEEYRSDQDLLAGWMDECCVLEPGAVATPLELWESWREWSTRRGDDRFIRSSRALGRKLSSRFQGGKDEKGDRIRFGIRLKTNSPIF